MAGVWFLLRSTRFGHRLYAVGGDEETARLSGVRTHRTLIGAHVLCSLSAAVTGLFIASRLRAGDPLVGPNGGYDLESIAAVVVGGTALAGGTGGVIGTLGGVLILAVLDNLFNALEVNAFLKDVLRGVIIIARRGPLRAAAQGQAVSAPSQDAAREAVPSGGRWERVWRSLLSVGADLRGARGAAVLHHAGLAVLPEPADLPLLHRALRPADGARRRARRSSSSPASSTSRSARSSP